MNNIGNRIRKLREHKGYSQESLANELGISQPSYARLEKCDKRINILRLIQIAATLQTSVAELIDEEIHSPSGENTSDHINLKDYVTSLKEEILFLRKISNNKQT
jgi:transcriptional regulator with XRE-family HTH domain